MQARLDPARDMESVGWASVVRGDSSTTLRDPHPILVSGAFGAQDASFGRARFVKGWKAHAERSQRGLYRRSIESRSRRVGRRGSIADTIPIDVVRMGIPTERTLSMGRIGGPRPFQTRRRTADPSGSSVGSNEKGLRWEEGNDVHLPIPRRIHVPDLARSRGTRRFFREISTRRRVPRHAWSLRNRSRLGRGMSRATKREENRREGTGSRPPEVSVHPSQPRMKIEE